MSKVRGALSLAGSVLVAALVACSPKPLPLADSGFVVDSGSLEDAGTAADFCRPRWQAICSAWAACENSAPYFPTLFVDVETCVQQGTANCGRFLDQPFAGLPYSRQAGLARFSECTAVIARQPACAVWADYLIGFNAHLDPECAPLPGTLADGTGCSLDDQCQSSFCRYQGTCGTCARRADVGESCQSNLECTLGSACVNGGCVPFRAPDAGCTQFASCTPGYACISGKCQTQLAEGAACAVNTPNPCRVGYCNGGHCQSFATDAGPGDFCGVDPASGVLSVCGRGSACQFVTQSYQGVCVARAQAGDRCFFDNGFQGAQCDIFSQCTNGVCSVAPEPSCTSDGGVHPARRDGGILPAMTPGADVLAEGARNKAIVCDALFACPRYAGLVANFFSSRAGCDDVLGAFLNLNLTAPHAATNSLATCNTALQALPACEIVDRNFGVKPALAACAQEGTLPAGAICEVGQQCGANARCNAPLFATSLACGVCSELRGAGESCIDSRDCARGLACGQGHCIAGGAAGATCSSAAPCDVELACVAGVCAATPDVGAACSPSASTCAVGLWCNTNTSKCEVIQVASVDGGAADAGTACGTLNGSMVYCPWGWNCRVTNAVSNTGLCETARGLGEACTFSGGLDGRGGCRFPGVCRDNVCSFFDDTFCQ